METPEWTRPIELEIQREHRELAKTLQAVKLAISEARTKAKVDGPISQITGQLHALRDRLDRHFTREDQGGYLDEATSRVPQLTAQAMAIEREHPALLAELDQLIAAMSELDALRLEWADLDRLFHAFAEKMSAHEATENHILQAGFNQQLGFDD